MNRKLFYILNLTWGLIMTFLGAVPATVLRCTGVVPERYGGCWCFVVGKNWGGISLGLFIFVSRACTDRKAHEFGHAIQNAVLGPFFIFLVAIPSFVRCCYRNLHTKLHTNRVISAYDSVWFEGQATRLGEKFIKEWDE